MAHNGICPHLCASPVDVEVPVIGNPLEASDHRVLSTGSDLVHGMKLLDDWGELVIDTKLKVYMLIVSKAYYEYGTTEVTYLSIPHHLSCFFGT